MKFQCSCDIMKREKFNQNAYVQRYIAKKKDKISLLVDKGKKDKWKEAAKEEGKSLNRFVVDLVDQYINGK